MEINRLYFGDNLTVLREKIPDDSIDLCYIDPPFNSARNYFVIFKDRTGSASQAQEEAFTDTWTWTAECEYALREIARQPYRDLFACIEALHTMLKESPMMAYLVSMAQRFVEIHRVLKPTGSFYLHCDPTASHYLKILCDAVFGPQCFRNEITWKRTFAHGNVGRNYGAIADTIFWYTRGERYTWNQVYTVLSDEEILHKYPLIDPDGRRWQSVTLRNPGPRPNLRYPYAASNGTTYLPHPNGWSCSSERMRKYDSENRLHFPARAGGALRLKMYADESPGEKVQNIWADIPPISANSRERLGYPTQKPLALLRRIIEASSDPGDVILDCYCGCGTTVHAAHELGRQWIGIDITPVAVAVIKSRMEQAFPGLSVPIDGFPADVEGAKTLFETDPYRFQAWACTLVGAYPRLKKGADRGVDGDLPFFDYEENRHSALVQVKGGKVGAAQVRDLVGTVQREKAPIGLFVCLEEPTRPMLTEAASAGLWSAGYGLEYPRIQILPIRDLLEGRVQVRMPPQEKRSVLGFKASRGQRKGQQTEAKLTQMGGQSELTLE